MAELAMISSYKRPFLLSQTEREVSLNKMTELLKFFKNLKCEHAYNYFVKQLLYHYLALRIFDERTDNSLQIDDSQSDLTKSTLTVLQSQLQSHLQQQASTPLKASFIFRLIE
jgi:hypothetical protein